MASANPTAGAQPDDPLQLSGGPSPSQIAAYTDLSISLILARWPALTIAVTNQWGGPDSEGKRDWLAGVISELFAERPDTDEEDIEDVLLQVLADEFDSALEDESEIEVAKDICRLRKASLLGEFAEIDAMRRRWEEKVANGRTQKLVIRHGDESSDEEDEGGVAIEDDDVDMQDAPPAQSRPEPEVDEEGFTKVVTRKKR